MEELIEPRSSNDPNLLLVKKGRAQGVDIVLDTLKQIEEYEPDIEDEEEEENKEEEE